METHTLDAAKNLAIHIASLREKYPEIDVGIPTLEFTDPHDFIHSVYDFAISVRLKGIQTSTNRIVVEFRHKTLHGNEYPVKLAFEKVTTYADGTGRLDRP